jgi:multiple sugar transport system ATP-binding protein
MVYVTHDQIEAMTLADRIAVMKGGVIQQLGAPHEIYSHPVNRFVAGFIGSPAMNFITGELTGPLEPGTPPVFSADGIRVPLDRYAFNKQGAVAGPCVLGIRPENVVVGAASSARAFSHEIEIEIVEPMGADTLVWTKLAGTNFTFLVDSENGLAVGERTTIGFDPGRASLFDEATGDRL